MKKAEASWSLEIWVTCPYVKCGNYMNIMDSSEFVYLHDDGSPLRTFEPGKNYDENDPEIKHYYEITCPECHKEFKLSGITW
jgi:hypothetical protein